jgi:hypothetical protein
MRISVPRIEFEVSYSATWCCASSRPCKNRRWSGGFTHYYEGSRDVHQWRQHSQTRDFHFLHLQMTWLVPLLFLTHQGSVGLEVLSACSPREATKFAHLLLDSSNGCSSRSFPRDLESLFCRKILAPPSALSSAYEDSRLWLDHGEAGFAHSIVVTGAGLKSPIGR